MALTLAIDLGTTNLKVGLVDEQGKIFCLQASGVPTMGNATGAAEHDPQQLKDLLISLCKKVLKDNDKGPVKYIVSSGYQFGLMMMDEHRKPLTGITLLTDTRSQTTFSDFISFYTDEDIYRKTGCPLISQYVLPRLFYFFREQPELYKKANYFTDSKAFLFEWLTGAWVTDMSTAGATQFYNIQDYQWDQELLSKLDLSGEQFPAVADGTQYSAPLRKEIAEMLGLKEKVEVLLGIYDGAALGMGLSGFTPNVGIINIGTTAMLRIPGEYAVLDKDENKRIQAYAIKENFFLNGGALNNAALPVDWMRKNLFDININDPDLQEISHEPPLISLPYLTGERDSLTGPYASGVFFGMRRNHSKTDFVRSTLEGVAFSMRYIYDALRENNMHVKEIRMGGGGVNIKAWPQIFADILGVPVTLPPGNEMALVGNAMLAFTMGGMFKDLNEASLSMLKAGERITPDKKAVDIRDKQYRFFKKLRESLAPLFKEHQEVRY